MTASVLDFFRLASLLSTAGDRLVANLGLTSARWQILGAIVAAEHPEPVAWLARNMGANRQNVQRIVNDLKEQGLVKLETNPHHRRAQLVVLTEKGRLSFAEAMRLQAPWADRIVGGIAVTDLEAFQRVVVALRQQLERTDQDDRGGSA